MKKSLITFAAFLLIGLSVTPTPAQDKRTLTESLLFYASFDGTTDANLCGSDGSIYTADTIARKSVQKGLHTDAVVIEKGAGKFGDCLRFKSKTEQIVFYKAAPNQFHPKADWSGTVSFWMRLDPDKDLPPGYVDPLQITDKAWNNASFFVDFDQVVPREFRLGVFSDYKKWNPTDIKWEEIAEKDRPMVPVKKPPFSKSQWTHVAFTFENINPSEGKESSAKLYLNGKLQGFLKRPLHFDWAMPTPENDSPAVIMLGIYYVGDFDEFAIFNKAMNADDIVILYHLPDGLR
jgi:hypothetical protein